MFANLSESGRSRHAAVTLGPRFPPLHAKLLNKAVVSVMLSSVAAPTKAYIQYTHGSRAVVLQKDRSFSLAAQQERLKSRAVSASLASARMAQEATEAKLPVVSGDAIIG